jgi:hypothetical protein
MTFFPLAFHLDLGELALLNCLTQVYALEKNYDQLTYHETSNDLR